MRNIEKSLIFCCFRRHRSEDQGRPSHHSHAEFDDGRLFDARQDHALLRQRQQARLLYAW